MGAKRSRAPAAAPARRERTPKQSLQTLRRPFLPSGRSLLLGWVIVAVAAGGYAAARETSVFSIRRIEVEGAPAPDAAAVRRAVDDVRGSSLVSLDGGALIGRVDAVPAVYGARYDRAFPHTLRILVRPEQPVAVLRAGRTAWLVSANARVLAGLRLRSRPELPRIWVPRSTSVAVGATLDPEAGGTAARALAPLARGAFPARIASVSLARGELAFALAGGVELRLGRPDDLRLKLAVARRIVRRLPSGSVYLDVSVPERPVSGLNPQVSG